MAKQIVGIGTTANDGTGDTVRVAFDKVNDNFDEVYSFTGWEQITDTTYTSGSPLTIATGVTGKIQTGTVTKIQTQIPSGVTTFWDTTTDKLLGVNNGDAFTLSLRFKAKMDVINGYFDVALNIGGALGKVSNETSVFTRASGTEQKFDIDLSYFTGTTFITNGGTIEIIPTNGNIEIYDIVLVIFRIHKGQ
jgi:hypothetical protein